MAEFYKVNSEKIVGGPGRLVVKDYDGTFPEKISDVIDVTDPYDLKAGWIDLGSTNDGITTSRGFDTNDFEVDQVMGVVDQEITGWTHTLQTTLAENDVENRQLAIIGGQIIETPPVLGTATTLTGALGIGATIISVTSAVGMTAGGFINLSEGGKVETKAIARIQGNTVYLKSAVSNAYTVAAAVAPVTELGSKRMGFGTVDNIPFKTYAVISKKKDDSLYMCVIRKAKVSGDDKEQAFGKDKRTIPLALNAFPVDDVPQDENVYYEIEQII